MNSKLAKGFIFGFSISALLFGLFFCIDRDRAANSLPKNDKSAPVKSLGQAFVDVAKKVQPAVVNITTEKTITIKPWERFGEDFFKGTPFEDFFKRQPPRKQKQRGEGSGVIVDPEGYILTNNHVVAGADKLTIHLFDGRELKGTVKGTDPKTDLAVVHVEAKDLPVATLGDSDKIQVGEWALSLIHI